jgi:hypothetical protein
MIFLTTGAATLAVAAPAVAAPSAKDAKGAIAKADHAISVSFAAARSGGPRAADRLADAARLQARAGRVARRAGSDRRSEVAARLLRGAAATADTGFDGYADLLAEVPPELQPALIEALERFGEMRTDLVEGITDLVELLPADAQQHALDAITAFTADGDVEALIAALSDPAFVDSLQAELEALITDLTGLTHDEIFDLDDINALLPPDLCAQISAMLEQFGIPAPPGFCGS